MLEERKLAAWIEAVMSDPACAGERILAESRKCCPKNNLK